MTVPPASESVRAAVVGLGYWGPNLVRNMQELPGAEIAYVCDSNPELLDTLTRRYPAVTGTTQFADILEDPTVDAVVIATPVGTHFNLASAALRTPTGRRSASNESSRRSPPQPCSTAAIFHARSAASPMPVFMP